MYVKHIIVFLCAELQTYVLTSMINNIQYVTIWCFLTNSAYEWVIYKFHATKLPARYRQMYISTNEASENKNALLIIVRF